MINIRDAIQGYLESLKKHGEPIPVILRHTSGRRLTVPNHRELAKGTLRALIREAGLTKEQFAELL